MSDDLTAAQCMFRAYDALVGAAERFATDGNEPLARTARRLAFAVAAAEPPRHAPEFIPTRDVEASA